MDSVEVYNLISIYNAYCVYVRSVIHVFPFTAFAWRQDKCVKETELSLFELCVGWAVVCCCSARKAAALRPVFDMMFILC